MASFLGSLFGASGPMASGDSSTRAFRAKVAKDTIERSSALIAEHAEEGASAESRFVDLETLESEQRDTEGKDKYPITEVEVVNMDAFALARKFIVAKAPPGSQRPKIAVLNLASDELRAGGWEWTLSRTQEEALCYSSTLYLTLNELYYPWPNTGPGSAAGIYSPGVLVHRDDLDHNLRELSPSDRFVCSVLTVAAPRSPKLTSNGKEFEDDSIMEDLERKIRLVYSMAADNGNEYLILGAMGCGAYRCPPHMVACEMKNILMAEFEGRFRKVYFAVYSKKENGPGNFDVFKKVFEGVKV